MGWNKLLSLAGVAILQRPDMYVCGRGKGKNLIAKPIFPFRYDAGIITILGEQFIISEWQGSGGKGSQRERKRKRAPRCRVNVML